VAATSLFSTRMYVGTRREKALVFGIPDFADQHVNVVDVASGSLPGAGAVLSDTQNAAKGKFDARAVRIVAGDGRVRSVPVSGEGRSFLGGANVANGYPTFYTRQETAAKLSGTPGYTWFALRVDDHGAAAVDRTIAAVRRRLRAVPGFAGFTEIPQIRKPGDYPYKEGFEQVASVMTAVTLLALLSALVLLSNTMSTLIGEQTGEIAAMKAVGGSRRQIARIYRRTALMLGALGGAFGVVLGLVLGNVLTGYFADVFYGVNAGWHVDAPVLVASLLVGLLGPPLAALPAIRRAARLPVAQALQATGSAVGGQGRVDLFLRRVGFLPESAQIGLRNVGRRKRRVLATAMQVALSVGALLALLALSTSVGNATRQYYDDMRYDIYTSTVATRPFTPEATRVMRTTPGVRGIQPLLTTSAKAGGKDVLVWGTSTRPLMDMRVTQGRWYTAADAAQRAPVAVLGRQLADHLGVGVGDTAALQTPAGPARVRVIGISSSQNNEGLAVNLPLASLQAMMHTPGEVNTYWVVATSKDHAFIDRLTTRLEDTLGAHGTQITTAEVYAQRADNIKSNATLTQSITVLGLVIVAISMVGLVNAMTMAVLERTREIGMLRCVGARARDIRRIFATEGMVVALIGWVLGLPAGYLLARALIAVTNSLVDIDMHFAFPPINLAITLVGTIVLAILVLLAPVRRAVRFKPGEALRYA
ncbi:MAG TPA: FtsX-like permease family protein, partial [Solirubrobacteraceae bacterium]|nr:FtsX-like permease family protein [Solirubrobacteraceae bacterium]